MNPSGYCAGCYRTIDEIAAWSKMTDEQKLTVLEKLFERQDEKAE